MLLFVFFALLLQMLRPQIDEKRKSIGKTRRKKEGKPGREKVWKGDGSILIAPRVVV